MRTLIYNIIALCCLTLSPLTATAQSIFFKIGGGFATQTGAPRFIATAKGAIGYEYEFNQRFTFAPSLGFTGRGWQVNDVVTPDMLFDDKGNMLNSDGQITTIRDEQAQRRVETIGADGQTVYGDLMWSTMHRSYSANYVQLDLPFVYYLRQGERRYFTFTAGPWVAYGVGGKRTTEGDGRVSNDRKTRYTDNTFSLAGARRFDTGLKVGVGYQFPSWLTINLEGEFGLVPTNRISTADASLDPFGAHAGRNMSLMVTLSYKLNKSKWRGED